MGWGENMGLAQGKPALAGASPTEKACPILLNQYCNSQLVIIASHLDVGGALGW